MMPQQRTLNGVALKFPEGYSRSPSLIVDSEPYIIYCDDMIIETQKTEDKAAHAAEVLNDHEKRNGRFERFKWAYCPARQ
jgi:hypothetical protein